MPLTLSIKDYSKHSGIGIKALRKMISDGEIPATKISNKFMVLVEAADECIAKQCIKSTERTVISRRNIDDWFDMRKASLI